MKVKFDCRFFIGEKPCKFKKLCEGCTQYSPMGIKILIIKLGAIGDVLRTTPLLIGLREKYKNSYITWLTEKSSKEVLDNNPFIDRLLILDLESYLRLSKEEFDLLICLDKDYKATSLASLINSKEKLGFGLNKFGTIYPLNKESEYTFLLGISDELKFKQNRKTYQELIFECCRLPYKREGYIFNLQENDIKFAEEFFKNLSVKKEEILVGLNTGSGEVFATKKWLIEGYIALAEKLVKDLNFKVILLGGENERERNKEIKEKSSVPLLDSGGKHSIKEFAAIIKRCNLIVTGDTLAMHLAIAVKTPVIAIFGPTCEQEVDLYGLGEKIFSDVDCSPCYLAKCNQEISMKCMKEISVEKIFEVSKKILKV